MKEQCSDTQSASAVIAEEMKGIGNDEAWEE